MMAPPKRPITAELLKQLECLEQWCIEYRQHHPKNYGTYNAGSVRGLYKPLRDGVIFYSRGWGWRLRKRWQEAIEAKRQELQADQKKISPPSKRRRPGVKPDFSESIPFRRVIRSDLVRVSVQAGPRIIQATWWLLTLECGHQVIRQRKVRDGCPRKCHCDVCAQTWSKL